MNETDEHAQDEPGSDWLPPVDPEMRMDNPHEDEADWQPLPIPEGSADGDQ